MKHRFSSKFTTHMHRNREKGGSDSAGANKRDLFNPKLNNTSQQ